MKIDIVRDVSVPTSCPDTANPDADAVVHLSFSRDSTMPPHVTCAEIRVLRSKWGDPATHRVLLDLGIADPALTAAREKSRADEIAAARATLERHGVA